jgi:glutamine amidotransferase
MGAIRTGIVDYGIGNLKSVASAVAAVGGAPCITSKTSELATCDRLILPGVGAFRHGMHALRSAGLDVFIRQFVADERPLLGICLGMQLLTEISTEFGETAGLTILPGDISKLHHQCRHHKLRLPNVGWLPLLRCADNTSDLAERLFHGVDPEARFYFIHSFAASAHNPVAAAISVYDGVSFASIIASDNVIGTQFHPEKSGPEGLKMLANFIS